MENPISKLAQSMGMNEDDFVSCLNAKAQKLLNMGELIGICGICLKYQINPLVDGELHIMVNNRNGAVTPILGVNGFHRIMSSDPRFRKLTFEYSQDYINLGVIKVNGIDVPKWCPMWIRGNLTTVIDGKEYTSSRTEFFSDCVKNSNGWQQSPARMLHHRCMAQLVRSVLGVPLSDEGSPITESPEYRSIPNQQQQSQQSYAQQQRSMPNQQQPMPQPQQVQVPPQQQQFPNVEVVAAIGQPQPQMQQRPMPNQQQPQQRPQPQQQQSVSASQQNNMNMSMPRLK